MKIAKDSNAFVRLKTTAQVLLFLIVCMIATGILWGNYLGSHPVYIKRTCLSNTKQLALSMLLYTNDSDDHLPFARNWIEATTEHNKWAQIYTCPTVEEELHAKYGYAYNSAVSGIAFAKIKDPAETYLLFDSVNLVRDAADPVTSLPAKGRHNGRNNIARTDGSTISRKPPGLP